MPFKLTFSIEAIIPVEVGLTSLRVKTFDEQKNQMELNANLYLIDEVKDEAQIRIMKYKEAMTKYYDRRVKIKRFNPGDFVLRRVS